MQFCRWWFKIVIVWLYTYIQACNMIMCKNVARHWPLSRFIKGFKNPMFIVSKEHSDGFWIWVKSLNHNRKWHAIHKIPMQSIASYFLVLEWRYKIKLLHICRRYVIFLCVRLMHTLFSAYEPNYRSLQIKCPLFANIWFLCE